MGVRVIEFRETPNPNAVKCELDRSLGDRPRSYFRAEEAEGDPVGRALFAIEGVTNVLISGDWASVSKRAEADWGPIKEAVRRVMAGVDG